MRMSRRMALHSIIEKKTAMLYSNGNMVFQYGNNVESGKTLINSYTGFGSVSYTDETQLPWYNDMQKIVNVSFKNQFGIVSTSRWFANNASMLKTVNYTNANVNYIKDMSFMYYDCQNLITQPPVCGDNVTNLSYTYGRCFNLTGSPVCGVNVVNMKQAYIQCRNLTGSPVCGNNVTDMNATYYMCYNLTGSPVCGDNVTNMDKTYFNCYNLTGAPVCGDNVINMSNTYSDCRNLTGSPVCGNNVTNMTRAYSNCQNLTGSPVCGNNVTDISYAYFNCRNITGSPVCGNNVTNMNHAYTHCTKLTGPAICGNNVTDISYAYQNCVSISQNAYLYSANINVARSCFVTHPTNRRLNIYLPINSTTLTTAIYNNTYSIVGANVTWTNSMASNGCYYNRTKNIYIYPVQNVHAMYVANEM